MTRIVRCAKDAAGLDFLVADGFLDCFACDHLSDVYRASSSIYEAGHRDPMWQNRLLGHRDVTDGAARDAMGCVVRDAINEVTDFYEQYPKRPLCPDVLHLVGWREGMKMAPHADNARESGEVHEFHWRDYSGVLYLNDDFEGGELYLPKQDVMIKPARGMFVSLPCGLSHMHGVREITSGLRITMAFFLTTDISRADRGLLEKST